MSIQSLDDVKNLRNGLTVIRRLRWIENRVWWRGAIHRADIVARFGISPQQASQDIASFHRVAPGRIALDQRTKAFMRVPGSEPIFSKEPLVWLADEAAEGNTTELAIERMIVPTRRARSEVVATIIKSYADRSAIRITYQSLTRAEASSRVICPHHVVDTGDRFHLRAWDDANRRFSDFVVGRVISAEPWPSYPWVDGMADTQWNETVSFVLKAAPSLSEGQKRAVETDYGMKAGRAEVVVRKALVIYLAERLGILEELQGAPIRPGLRELTCINKDELRELVPAWASGHGP